MNTFYWTIEIFSSFIEAFLSFYFCCIIVGSKIKENAYSVFFLSVAVAVFIVFMNHLALTSVLNSTIFIILNWIFLIIAYREKYFKLFIFNIVYHLMMFLCDMIIVSLMGFINNETVVSFSEKFSPSRIIAVVISKALLTVFVTLLVRLSSETKIWNNRMNIMLSASTALIALLTALMFSGQFIINANKSNVKMMIVYLLLLIVLFVLYFSVLSYSKADYDKQKLSIMEQQNKLLEKTLKEQENTFSLWRKSVHDYKNSIYALHNFIETGENEELRKYVEEKIDLFKDSAIYMRTGNATIDTVVNSKMRLAESQGILFTVNMKIPENIAVSDVHLAVIIGNLLDNAIEAEDGEENKYIHIQTIQKNNLLIIEISNSFSKNTLSLESYKSDKDFHGIGLLSVRQIVSEYDGSFTIKLENDFVVAAIGLKI